MINLFLLQTAVFFQMGVIYKNSEKKKLEHVATVKGNNIWKCEIYMFNII